MRIQLTISQAKPEDMSELLAIQKEAYQAEARIYDDYSIPPLMESLEDIRKVTAESTLLKAEINGVKVGSIRATLNGKVCEVGRLSVKPKYQRQGIGRALLRACETVFAEADYCELFTGSKSAANIKLYETLGYHRNRAHVLSPKVTLVYFQKKTTAPAAI